MTTHTDTTRLISDIERKAKRETHKHLAVLFEADDRLRKDPDCRLSSDEIARSCAWVSHAIPLLSVHI